MQQHAIALGYFFLAVFCIFTSAQCFEAFRGPLIVAALLAFVAGIGYIAEPMVAGLRAVQAWIVQIIRLAQETPTHSSATTDEKHASH